jgi:hypothetical protein
MLKVKGDGMQAKVEHIGSVLHCNIPPPKKIAALVALDSVRYMLQMNTDKLLVDGKTVTSDQALEVLRRFILTR